MARRDQEFQAIRSEGGLLPPDLLRRILDPAAKLDGTRPEDYGLPQGERLNETITQSWNILRKHWADFRTAVAGLADGAAGTGLTNDKWNLPLLRELGFGLLPTTTGPEVSGRTYAISRFFGPVPIHLVGVGLSLDRKAAGQRGAAAVNPHGLVQEFLNRSPGHLWAIVSNGCRLRVLRDNQALSRQSFLEFDLEAMFAGEVYSDFVLLWLVVHATRLAPRESDRPDTCWLEAWSKEAEKQGTRALGDLRGGVERALQILGEGFTSHPKNAQLRDALRSGHIPLADFHGQLLRVVYRLIFLFVAEDRVLEGQPLLHPRDESDAARTARQRFAEHYGTARLRDLAGTIKGSRHGDLWRQFQILVGALSGEAASAGVRENLALPALGSFLWSPGSTATLNDAELTNYDLLEALRHLAFTRQGRVLRPVDYRNLGAEELGGVYESLLALTPQISADGARFTFAEFAGNERKTSGSYYTPDSLVQCLLDSALDPVVEEALRGKSGVEAEQSILALKVCDPAVGSGHFLVGAAHRLARHLARVRAQAQGESEPSPPMHQHALRDVIGRCLYGVDINPMATELCRVSLWLEALEPGQPLSFLDHHIRVGNSLLGATPELISRGIPDEAFTPIEGDDGKTCGSLKRRNRQERVGGQKDFYAQMVAEPKAQYSALAPSIEEINALPDHTFPDILLKAAQFGRFAASPEYRHAQLVADAWCAAFVWRKGANLTADAITTETLHQLKADPDRLLPAQVAEVERLAVRYQFFHWHFAFPEVFAQGGFKCVLGNPPWEQLEQQSDGLLSDIVSGTQHFVEHSSRYPLTGGGRKNLYGLFAELACSELAPNGNVGMVLPTGILQDLPAARLTEALLRAHRLASAYDFENRRRGGAGDRWFPDAHPQQRICLFSSSPGHSHGRFVSDLASFEDLADPDRAYTLTADEISALCDESFRVPMFRRSLDAAIAKCAYANSTLLGPLMRTSPPGVVSGLVFNADPESKRQRRSYREGDVPATMCRVYEGSYIFQYDHRYATYDDAVRYVTHDEKLHPTGCVHTEHYLPVALVRARLEALAGTVPGWYLVLRRQAAVTNAVVAVAALIPFSGAEGSLSAFFVPPQSAARAAWLCASLNTYVVNFLARIWQSGPNLNKNVYAQLPAILEDVADAPSSDGQRLLRSLVLPRVLELIYTADDLRPFARDLGYQGAPFLWDERRRFILRCEVEAVFFHLFFPSDGEGSWRLASHEAAEAFAGPRMACSSPRDVIGYIMDTFPIIRREDERMYGGEYRTKRVILEVYDALAEALRTGRSFASALEPAPALPDRVRPRS